MLIFNKRQKVDFIVCGTQKGGTSALDYYLRKHPEIGMANKKELHFFDNENIFNQKKIKYSQYENQFNFKLKKKVYGEITPIYMYWKPCCKRIWDYNPNIKLIFILRNPIERAFSHWNMEFDKNLESNNFINSIQTEINNNTNQPDLQHRVKSYIYRGFYSEQIIRFKNTFPENQLKFVKYEDFKIHQQEKLNDIFNFLGVNSNNYFYERRTIHKRKKHSNISQESKDFLINIFREDIKKVESLLNWNCNDWC
ncbi:hypothetical protein PK35_13855 [Tamlana nanhaiensis]|uniref:Sulfotransferase domain-containing protein n=1 Tax=Neotamlana nanhaiensis TaxID=1382798 RepID=A0A0D7VXC4_9FLAO|nr:sulfotransferase [Tamlana nanhaiensis]KJD31496.1 hypothetical protein PK35_13855 [Tamlana nanhaiensis]